MVRGGVCILRQQYKSLCVEFLQRAAALSAAGVTGSKDALLVIYIILKSSCLESLQLMHSKTRISIQ